jgi:acyl dehydratase
VRRAGVEVDRDHLLAYQRLCGFTVDDALPHTYPHVLGFPLQVTLMADRRFPLPLPGLVHLENVITVHRRLTAEDVLDVTVHAQALRDHPKGRLVDLVTEVDVDGERVWEGRSTYLRRGQGRSEARPPVPAPELPMRPPAAVVRVPECRGREYAAVSGDVNPIHVNGLAAKAFGMPGTIAHGMWTKARALAALAGRHGPAFTVDVVFKAPVRAPSTVWFHTAAVDGGWDAKLVSPKGRDHLLLTLREPS